MRHFFGILALLICRLKLICGEVCHLCRGGGGVWVKTHEQVTSRLIARTTARETIHSVLIPCLHSSVYKASQSLNLAFSYKI